MVDKKVERLALGIIMCASHVTFRTVIAHHPFGAFDTLFLYYVLLTTCILKEIALVAIFDSHLDTSFTFIRLVYYTLAHAPYIYLGVIQRD